MLAITKGSLKAVFRSPSAVVFSFVFPLIFILVFGFIGGGGGGAVFTVVFDKNADTANSLYPVLKGMPNLKVVQKTDKEIKESLEKGRMTAVLNIKKNPEGNPQYYIGIKTSEAVSKQNIQLLQLILTSVANGFNKEEASKRFADVLADVEEIPGRTYRTIDFILPGQLGFSLLSAGVFGVAFLFFNLRQQLVLKRFYATPIHRMYIVLGEALSRVIFQMITAVIIIGVGHFAFNFTLVNGLQTFMEIMILSFIALVLFMGFGFIVSGLAKNESTIPPFANLITLPQFLLAGTFFSIDVFPHWLQPICRVLPLTHFNNAMRNIAFEGASLMSCWEEIGILILWIIGTYAVATKTFKWE